MASRKPSLNPVNPFKTNMLASATPSTSSSSRASIALPSSSNTSNPNTALTSLSPLSNLTNLPRPTSGLPSSIRPSPSFTPSSLGAASTGTSTGTGTSTSSRSASAGGPTITMANTNTNGITVPTCQKRYSSPFGHRYSSPAGGRGSTGSHTSTSEVKTGGSSGGGSIDRVDGGRFVGGPRGRSSFGPEEGEGTVVEFP
ncbi:hypothetical protein GYMLUDRAFT_888732 [Collybiopsis luxurians FD-317 M1]|uniref:Uncharacterized protein n=1 Tax=Collybiopsis luxurians FD-317 M1 TaxID=944289 RepID=A0A0D0BYE9_9AGAR|nr:hypothetical protein GYMLUDRAFT_888732 [Collybiopsis luxurians FD-317 M1]